MSTGIHILRRIWPIRPHRLVLASAAVALVVGLAACGSSSSSSTSGASASANSKSKYVIALSNSYLANSWRKTMVSVFENTAKQAQAAGLISGYKVQNVADNVATEQIAQLKSLILQHVNAIVIDAADPNSLNPTIQQACSAGIKVVVFDSLATAPCAYKLTDAVPLYGTQTAQVVAQQLHGKGNVIILRGVVGSAPEKTIYENEVAEVKKYPGLHLVDTLVGGASISTSQQAVAAALPSLPKIQGVITESGAIGVINAFKNAGKPLPVVDLDNSGEALRFWEQQHKANGFNAASLSTEPGQAAAAFWMALDLLHGKSYPNVTYTFPNIVITQKDLPKWLPVTPNGTIAAWDWTHAQTDAALQANMNHQAVPQPPIPATPPAG